MGQETPIEEYLHKAKGLVNDFKNLPDPTKYFQKKPDTSWHDSMVKEANESFRKYAGNHKVGGSDGKSGTAQKKAATKKTARKRVAGKK